MQGSHENLKTIWFEDEMLPKWAQLLDAAARLCPVSEGTQNWFTRFTNSSGTDDAQTITTQVQCLQTAIQKNESALLVELRRTRDDGQPTRIIAAWKYTLETMINQSMGNKTCSWTVEDIDDAEGGDFGSGDITLRRV